ncbi:MAG: class I SAM-dependent methyltransferase [Bacteroidales bacterium]|nr:class I SAM-dependent methyltransferase [Bacteroidales bacterium]
MEKLTDKKFWENYWLSKKNIFKLIPRNFIFSDLFSDIIRKHNPKTAIEIGGFPGLHSIFLYKYFQIKPTLLDIVVIPSIVDKLCQINNIPHATIACYEADFFDNNPSQQYDLVFSNGFIEHFTDTEKVIQQHIQYLNQGGTLLITLPNFKSLNGWFQRVFDPENYRKHNIQCMDKKLLERICENLQLHEVNVFYYGYFSIWIEEKAQKKLLARLTRLILFYPLKLFFRLTKINTKYFAPYLVIRATKR